MAEQQVRKLLAADSPSPNLKASFPGMERVETGALQINDDWPGLFIRGDGCMKIAVTLRYVIGLLAETPARNKDEILHHMMATVQVGSLLSLIEEDVLGSPKGSI